MWLRFENDESVLALFRYLTGDLSSRFDELMDEAGREGDIDNLKESVTDLYKLDDRFYVEYVGSGLTAVVWYVRDVTSRRSYALKIATGDKVLSDGPILRDLLGYGVVADVYAYTNRFVLMDYIEGDLVSDYDEYELEDRGYVEHMRVLLEEIYDAGYIATDLHDDNVKYDEGSLWILDVGNFISREDSEDSLEDVIVDFEDAHRLY